jgi:hypothetical protein
MSERQDTASLNALLNKATNETNAAVYVCLELTKGRPDLAERIQAFVQESMPEFFAELKPEHAGDGMSLDIEAEVLPTVQWLRFLDGFKAAGGSAETKRKDEGKSQAVKEATSPDVEAAGDPILTTIKHWLAQRSYTEKLSFFVGNELIMHEDCFEKPDNRIGNDFLRTCREAVLQACGDPAYLKESPRDEAIVTAMMAVMDSWEV